MKGIRADIRLVEAGLAPSRERARSLIMSGAVYLGEKRIEKSGETVPEDAALTVREDPVPFVSRGGLKLEKAIRKYGMDISGLTVADIGASTGGFTDCMLIHGAKKVYAIDVGYGQLDWKLRSDPRVKVMERTNARFMERAWFDEELDFLTMDVSFISIKLILPAAYVCMAQDGRAVVLVKPQFEAGRAKVGKNGVVRDRAVHAEVLLGAARFASELGFTVEHIDYSPITGPKGNIEYLLLLKKGAGDGDGVELSEKNITEIVDASHLEHDRA